MRYLQGFLAFASFRGNEVGNEWGNLALTEPLQRPSAAGRCPPSGSRTAATAESSAGRSKSEAPHEARKRGGASWAGLEKIAAVWTVRPPDRVTPLRRPVPLREGVRSRRQRRQAWPGKANFRPSMTRRDAPLCCKRRGRWGDRQARRGRRFVPHTAAVTLTPDSNRRWIKTGGNVTLPARLIL